ncbi:MAG: TlpA disulfide reductase family protein [Vicingaceae bacterium]
MLHTKNLNYTISLILLAIACIACDLKNTDNQAEKDVVSPTLGIWRMQMDLGGKQLPFNFSLDKKATGYEMVIMNADEKIVVNDIEQKADSLYIKMPVFESEFHLSISDSSTLKGEWINFYKGPDYRISVVAEHGKSFRFSQEHEDFMKDVSGKYEVTFTEENGDSFPAIGLIKQAGNDISGTFATETGDYRHLDGNFINDSLFLSTFDGSHAFLFEAENQDSIIKGTFWSGTHYKADWLAKRNPKAGLRNPDSLTFLKEGYERFAFALPNENGDTISLQDKTFQNKVTIVQIMGSWCPNCLDETKYLSSLHEKYNPSGLEVVAISFERTRSKEQAIKNLNSLQTKTKAPYPFLLAGWNRDTKATDVLPMLNHVMSYPTAIFIDKKGIVRKIHTGFYGPGTGEYYERFTTETEAFIEKLLAE